MTEDDNRRRIIEEAYRLSETALASDATAADAADARAMGFASVMIAGAAILAGMAEPQAPNPGLLVAALVLAVAGGLAGFSARPRDFYLPGARFDDFERDIADGRNALAVIEEMARFNDSHSRRNRADLISNARLISLSYLAALAGVLIAIVSQSGIVACAIGT